MKRKDCFAVHYGGWNSACRKGWNPIFLTFTGIGMLLMAALLPWNKNITAAAKANTGAASSASAQQDTGPYTVRLPVVLRDYYGANIYFVSTNGNDSSLGTATAPFLTVARGVKALKPGDILYLRSGTYVQSSPLSISKTGTATRPITIATAPGEPSQAIITGDTNGDGIAEVPERGSWSALVSVGGSYVTFRNIEVAYSGGRGIVSAGETITISNNNVHHIWRSGIQIFGGYNIVEQNTIWRAADSNYCNLAAGRLCNGNWDGGLSIGEPRYASTPGRGHHAIVRNNTIFHVSGEGLLCMHSDYALIEANVAYDNWALNFDLDQCSYTIVQKNLIYYTNDLAWWRSPNRPGTNIMVSNEGIQDSAGNVYPIGHDRILINNIMVGGGSNFYFWTGDGGLTDSALVNDLIANNTMVNTSGTGGINFRLDAGPHANTRVVNNIVLQSTGAIAEAGSTSGITFDHNLWSKTPSPAFASPADVVGNPQLMDPYHTVTAGAINPDWYKINPTSPAINKAVSLAEVPVDYWNNPRSAQPDMGAGEFFP